MPEIVTPSFRLVENRPKRKLDNVSDEDISDAAFLRNHEAYERMERELHAAFLSNRRNNSNNLIIRNDGVAALPDVFVVRFDNEELESDPLPPPPRILRAPARFRDGAASGTMRTNNGLLGAAAAVATRRRAANAVAAAGGTPMGEEVAGGVGGGSGGGAAVAAASAAGSGGSGASRRPPPDPESLLPLQVGNLRLISLGKIVADRPGFQAERVLFPVGFKAEREYVSGVNPMTKTIYTCEILDGERGPRFRVTGADDKKRPIMGDSATSCWTEVTNRINSARMALGKKPSYTTISGLDYFGLTRDRVAVLIEQLPNAHLCRTYQFRYFNPHGGGAEGDAGLLRKKKKKKSALTPAPVVLNGAEGSSVMVLPHGRGRPRKYPKSAYISKKEASLRAKKAAAAASASGAADAAGGAGYAYGYAYASAPTSTRKKEVKKKPAEIVLTPGGVPKASRSGRGGEPIQCWSCLSYNGEILACSKCDANYHAVCAGSTATIRSQGKWICPSCREARRKK